ncbi:hypothetical protein MJO28_016191 [Puccinia striiformis f. sp. tritici]|uniref:Uncharacterized protein n=4 Tax=Puccinia striiformis TaxID=27350 RepID=A0A0L0W0G0_9BASI|nr:hypothetical protein Pst134EA_030700 [Puccinia striiformis f. sp. tritici]KAI9600728.1 hypothetical protein H4Q26_000519 [Puccinia striiformis f. sp. tritici PST-130]KNF04780.1 hypothetical protein PSTG_02257 [Puccinia striiformis f. sp. tritici PST-78]POV97313.1 hypothetical protein PSTT_15136 [Puccinia striiformis]KAH9440597.1 hypothetical protein Pst134EB_031206 [Puccinia striiformis f. sp. tritici]KAH9446796.1 hypothetical protein Pst134EA_030700 [Puccinia striiformis f. sp. tritici]
MTTKTNNQKQAGLFNFSHILIGLTIGILLALTFNQLSSSGYQRWTKYLIKPASSAALESSDDHLSWLSWHKVQMNNPLSKHDHHNENHQEKDHTNHQPPTLKEEIKKIINSNKLKLDNFNIIHSNDEL